VFRGPLRPKWQQGLLRPGHDLPGAAAQPMAAERKYIDPVPPSTAAPNAAAESGGVVTRK